MSARGSRLLGSIVGWTAALMFLCAPPLLFAQPDYAPAIWKPAYNGHWYTTGTGHNFCVIHDMEGYYLSTISYIQQSATQVSIHYCVNSVQNGSDGTHNENNPNDVAAGQITQMVREQYWAWHVLCWNRHTLGTEHEGFVSSPIWYTEAMYQASAALQRHLCETWGIPKDRNHIIGHDEKKNASWVTWMQANYPAMDPTCNTHTDPGIYWDWNHFMTLITQAPAPPANLNVSPLSTNSIRLTWTDASTNETGFKIERAPASNGPWTQIATTAANMNIFTNTGLSPSTVYFYRVRAYNADGDSSYSNVNSATTGNAAPILAAIGNKTVTEGSPIAFTVTASDPGAGGSVVFADFETYSSGTANILFQQPHYSGSTDEFVDTNFTNYTAVATTFPAGHSSTRVLRSTWNFTNGPANAWVRLTTASAGGRPNPVIDFRQVLKFDIYTDRTLRVGVGCRETTNAPATSIGSDGGGSGSIEWAGVTNVVSGQPRPTRTVNAGTWQTLSFNLPYEPTVGFTGNGVLSTASGLGVLEHLALVPTITSGGAWNVYFDNFAVVTSNTLTYSLDAGAPAGAAINPQSGIFTWTPTEAQGPGIYDVTVRVMDNGIPPLTDFETISIVVNESNSAPALAAISNKTVAEGSPLGFTAFGSDSDNPVNPLTYSLDPGAPAAASIDPNTGFFQWTPSGSDGPGIYAVTVRVTDFNIDAINSTQLSAARTFNITVNEVNIHATIEVSGTNVTIGWNSVAGQTYRVQYKDNLDETIWHDIAPDVTATGAAASLLDPLTPGGRFYRVLKP